MPRPFRRLTLAEFADLLERFPFTRKINAVHMHHTWKPQRRDYRGLPTIEGMWRYHTVNLGWSDIAQHITIAPDGAIWTGRGWNEPPASASGHNGNRSAGPFMFEMIGDFDAGRDPFGSPQREVVLEVIARVQARFDLPVGSLRFHNQMSSKTCPGLTISYADILAALREMRSKVENDRGMRRRSTSDSPFPDEALAYREKTESVIHLLTGSDARTYDPPDAEHPDVNTSDDSERPMTGVEMTSEDPYKRVANNHPSRAGRNERELDLWDKIATNGESESDSGEEGWQKLAGSSSKASTIPHEPGRAARRRALCIGINNYPTAPLSGCVADARQWANELGQGGFDVQLLLDEQATREAILGALSNLIEKSVAGDIIVFQCAGHGTTVKDISGDEVEGGNKEDEALCPYDFASGALIIDDDLAEVFRRIPDGVNLTCFFDCCHSGTISRLGIGVSAENELRARHERPRFITASPELLRAHADYRRRMGIRGTAGNRGPDEMRQVVFSACLDSEVALESDGHGHFTLVAAPLLGSAFEGMTNEEFAARVTEGFGPVPRQHPELDCSRAARSRGFLRSLVSSDSKELLVASPWGSHKAAVQNGHISTSLYCRALAEALRAVASQLESRQ
ncbi:MAG TPA: caspase family protein [Pyrinomonadaceae bacterium]|nr:caspase family protein [Pyrinomonadaceae bacterium]